MQPPADSSHVLEFRRAVDGEALAGQQGLALRCREPDALQGQPAAHVRTGQPGRSLDPGAAADHQACGDFGISEVKHRAGRRTQYACRPRRQAAQLAHRQVNTAGHLTGALERGLGADA